MSQSTRPTGYSARNLPQRRKRRAVSPWLLAAIGLAVLLVGVNFAPQIRALLRLTDDQAGAAVDLPVTRLILDQIETPQVAKPGSCVQPSAFVPRTTAWACTVEEMRYDPCFTSADASAVVCGAEPLSGAPGFRVEGAAPNPALPLREVVLLNPADLAWIEYSLSVVATPVKLVNGQFYMPAIDQPGDSVLIALSEMMEMGDLDFDGDDDAAVLLVADPGDDRMFIYLGVVLNQNGSPQSLATTPLGDRITVDDLAIDGGMITVRMTTHGADDPPCCPTLDTTRFYHLSGSQLVQYMDGWRLELRNGIHCVPVAAPQSASATMRFAYQCSDGTWLRNGLVPGETWYATPVAGLGGGSASADAVAAIGASGEPLIPVVRLWQ